jgi:Na+/melibiose symporter-like transporter
LAALAHGSAPFILAIGADQLVKRFEQVINSAWAISNGTIAEPVEQEAQAFPTDLKKRPWLLWGMLVTAVITLAWMAASLLRTG